MPALAGLPSTSGLAAYPGVTGSLLDAFGYTVFTAQRAARKLEQRVFKRGYRQESPDHSDLYTSLRRTQTAHVAFERLRELGILNPDVQFDDLPDVWLGRVVTLGLLDKALSA